MFGLGTRERRGRKFWEVFLRAWDRYADRMDPPWSERLKEGFKSDAVAEFERFCGHAASDLLAVRFYLAGHTLSFTACKLLLIPAPPGVDQTGKRDGVLITGELRSRLGDILQTPQAVKLLGFDQPLSVEDPYDFILVKYQAGYAMGHAFNTLRVLVEKPIKPDWYAKCAPIFYAYWEHEFRLALRMPSALDDGFLRPLRYSGIVDMIRNGWPDPYEKWQEGLSDEGFERVS